MELKDLEDIDDLIKIAEEHTMVSVEEIAESIANKTTALLTTEIIDSNISRNLYEELLDDVAEKVMKDIYDWLKIQKEKKL